MIPLKLQGFASICGSIYIDTLYVCIHRVRTSNHCLGGKVVKMAYRPNRCFVVVFVFYLFFKLSHGVLYSSVDHIVLLENDTISNVIHNSPSAWVVEFYSSFCGHCHAFAPTWKKLSRMAKGEIIVADQSPVTA